MTTLETVQLLLPELTLTGVATLIYLLGAFAPDKSQPTLLGILGFGAVFVLLGIQDSGRGMGSEFIPYASGPLAVDYFGHAARWFTLAAGLLLLLLMRQPAGERQRCEFAGSLLLLIVGLMICAAANELVLIFVGLELVSIPTYVLLYLGKRDAAAQEATTKYFFLSILSSALLLYGFSFLYGVGGSTNLANLPAVFSQQVGLNPLAGLGLLLVIAGLGFRLTAVPFHFYAPDVYQGTSHANAGLLSTMPKVAGLLVLVRLVAVNLTGYDELQGLAWKVLLAVSLLTMTLGNILALWQNNLRRLLAYSSVAHGGYLLIGVSVGLNQALQGGEGAGAAREVSGVGSSLFYVCVYTFATLGVFAVLTALGGSQDRVEQVDDLAGLSATHPLAALAMAVFLFSLAGIPPLAGFWGKLTLFSGAVQSSGVTKLSLSEAGNWNGWFLALAIVGVLNAAIAAAYYLRLVSVIYFRPATRVIPDANNPGPVLAAALCAALVVGGGLFAGPMLNRAQSAGENVLRGAPDLAAQESPALQKIGQVGAVPPIAAAQVP